MGIDEPYLAFIFDEAMDFIENQMYYDENGKLQWHKEPCWWKEHNKAHSPVNNLELIKEMQAKLNK